MSRINTVVVAVITSNLRLAAAPGNVRLSAAKTGLKKESAVNVSQIITLDKQFLTSQLGLIGRQSMQQVDEGIKLVLGI